MSTVLSQFIGLLCTALCVPLAISPGVSAEPPKEDAVAVTVGNETIRVGDVQRALTRATGGKPINPAALATLQARTLEEAIQRRLVLAYARRTGLGSKEEFETARSDFLARLAYQHRSLEEYLKSQSISEDDWRRQLVWGVVWEKCLAKHVTPARREAYFQAHRREFDGSLVAVSYILLRPPESGAGVSPAYGRSTGETPVPPKEALVQRAQRLRDEILSGKISFAEAAAKYSAAPSGQQGGRLGQSRPRSDERGLLPRRVRPRNWPDQSADANAVRRRSDSLRRDQARRKAACRTSAARLTRRWPGSFWKDLPRPSGDSRR